VGVPQGAVTRAAAAERFDAMGVAFDSTGTIRGGAGEREAHAFERALARLSGAVEDAARRERSWLARVRAGLVAFLAFFDDEPRWGQLLIEARVRDAAGLGRERRVLGVLSGLLDDGSPQALGELTPDPQLTGELIAGGVLSVLRTCMLEGDERPLVELAPELMAFILTPYLGQAAARAELGSASPSTGEPALPDVLERRPVESPLRVTRRTRLVLLGISNAPRASNRQIARAAGLSDEGQTSRMLGRLRDRGLIENVGAGAAHGEPNEWLLTAQGRRLLGSAGGMARAGSSRPGDGLSSGGPVA
jgi:hypothetical protein